MPRNKITDLRNHLFETLERLKDEESPMDIDRAHAICAVVQAIIGSAKVEVEMVRAVSGRSGSEFFAVEPETRELPAIVPRQIASGGKSGG